MGLNIEKEQRAISYLKAFARSGEPYYVCYSGGKDSDVIRILCKLADVPHEVHHNITTVDAPETIQYIKTIPNVIFHMPELSMRKLIVKNKMPPTRLIRYCCSELKEKGGRGKIKVTGVRSAESRSRSENGGFVKILSKTKTVEKLASESGVEYSVSPKGGLVLNLDNENTAGLIYSCYRTASTLLNPILDWSDNDVWDFLNHYGCKANPLYQCGESRVGCIGCPLSGYNQMKKDFAARPRFRAMYVRAFDDMLAARDAAGMERQLSWATGEHVMRWWLGEDPMQMTLFDDAVDEEDMETWYK